MTPKEKAEELHVKYIRTCKISQFYPLYMSDHEIAKQCALIAAEEVITELYDYGDSANRHSEWVEIKEEIEKL